MAEFTGLTWDHPRGRQALERSAASGTLIEWHVHPLEGFESSPIDELAARYDVIVLDHPHLGDALATGALQSLDTVFEPEWLATLRCVGPSIRSYELDGHLWALPLDAATQVSARLPERVPENPATWTEVVELSHHQPVALSLAGPHAYLSFASLTVALGGDPTDPGDTGLEALDLLRDLQSRAPAGTESLNPIGMLERTHTARDIAYIPLVYGYVPYAQGPDPIHFGDAPTAVRSGSTIGGTGLALSSRCTPTPALLEYLRWLLHPVTQATYIPDNAGQPAVRSAWLSPSVNAASSEFYLATLATIDTAWVRPRVAGFTPFQSEASRVLREAILGERSSASALAETAERFAALGVRA